MRILLRVMVASFAEACVMEEPINELAGASLSEADICQDTKLGTGYDAPKKSRCAFCSEIYAEISHKAGQGHRPDRTNAGRDCHYWKPKYRLKKPDPECVGLPR